MKASSLSLHSVVQKTKNTPSACGGVKSERFASATPGAGACPGVNTSLFASFVRRGGFVYWPRTSMRKIVFDIETKNFFHETGSNDPASLDIAVVCIHDSATDNYQSFFEHELGKLWPVVEKADLLIGFNSDHFDIPLLNKYYPGDLTKIKSIDLLKEVKRSLGRRIKLDALASATLGRKKTADGALAASWWKKGEKEKVRDYCIEDVKITKELYEHVLKRGTINYLDGTVMKEIKLDTTGWETEALNAITHTLPF